MCNRQHVWWTVGFVAVVACGGSEGDPFEGSPSEFKLELVAGDIGGVGTVDGIGAEARFLSPRGLAFDRDDNLYVTDARDAILQGGTIRKISPGGVVTTVAGMHFVAGTADGPGGSALFDVPTDMVVDASGNLYIADAANDRIRKMTPAGVVTTFVGGTDGSSDGTGTAASFFGTHGLSIDAGGNLYVTQRSVHTIRKVTPERVVTTPLGAVRMAGSTDGTGAAARFNGPQGTAIDRAGAMFVTDNGNKTIRKVTPEGIVTTFAGSAQMSGTVDGTGADARFTDPVAIAIDRDDNLYVAETDSHVIRKITPDGAVTTLAGGAGEEGYRDGSGAEARFRSPTGLAVDSAGNIYVADSDNAVVRKITPAGVVSTLAGRAAVIGSTDGNGAAAKFNFLGGVEIDERGNLLITDAGNHTIRRITPNGAVTTLAGAPGMSGTADGPAADARFYVPHGITTDPSGNLYITDSGNRTIRKLSSGGAVTLLAGGAFGGADGIGGNAQFAFPAGIAIDGTGNLYVADQSNSTIRKLAPYNDIASVLTLAGTAQETGTKDGQGKAARFAGPYDLVFDRANNLYVSDLGNSTIRRISPTGLVTTLAGGPGEDGSADGIGPTARFQQPAGLAIDDDGNLYVADSRNATIRKVTPDGAVTTIAGTPGKSKIVLGNTPGFAFPFALAIDGDSLIVLDGYAVLRLHRK